MFAGDKEERTLNLRNYSGLLSTPICQFYYRFHKHADSGTLTPNLKPNPNPNPNLNPNPDSNSAAGGPGESAELPPVREQHRGGHGQGLSLCRAARVLRPPAAEGGCSAPSLISTFHSQSSATNNRAISWLRARVWLARTECGLIGRLHAFRLPSRVAHTPEYRTVFMVRVRPEFGSGYNGR